MSEIYWLTRLDYIHGFSIGLFVCSIVCTLVFGIIHIIHLDEEETFLSEAAHKLVKRIVHTFIAFLIISSAGVVFIPSTKEMLLVYAAGGSIEYIKDNDVVKQLPDKCIQAIDALLNEYIDGKEADE